MHTSDGWGDPITQGVRRMVSVFRWTEPEDSSLPAKKTPAEAGARWERRRLWKLLRVSAFAIRLSKLFRPASIAGVVPLADTVDHQHLELALAIGTMSRVAPHMASKTALIGIVNLRRIGRHNMQIVQACPTFGLHAPEPSPKPNLARVFSTRCQGANFGSGLFLHDDNAVRRRRRRVPDQLTTSVAPRGCREVRSERRGMLQRNRPV
jgi:hypothetical protein